MAIGRTLHDAGLDFETLIAELSSRFVNLAPAQVDPEIEAALRGVCEHLDIDFAVLWQWSAGTANLVPTHSHPASAATPLARQSAVQEYPWCTERMLAGRPIVLPSLEHVPPEGAVDRESARKAGIRSNLTLPLALGGEPPVGAVAFNTVRSERDWPETEVQRLQLVAQVFANALARRRHELALKDSEKRLALAADSAEAGLWTLDYGTGLFWLTDRCRDIFGFAPDEIVTLERLEASIHPDDRERVREVVSATLRCDDPAQVQYRIIHPVGGRVRWIDTRGRPQRGPDGRPLRLMGVSVDFTERKQAEDELRASTARLEAAADLAGLAFYEVDFREGTVFVDDGFADMCGIPPADGPGLEPLAFWIEHLSSDDRERVLEQRRFMHEGAVERLNIEYRYRHPKRGERWLHHVARVTERDDAAHVVRTFGVIRDVTERRQKEEVLRQSLAEIERLKDRLQAESDYLKAEISVVRRHGEVTGQSPAILKVLKLVEQVASTDATVLVQGETGSGKELVAEALHRLSRRGSRVMVKVNCAALPSGLVESELFGRERGAFTGAMTRQVGRFEVADGSTLFLDEIGEVSLEVQAKLLRALETGEFERLGSPRTVKVDVRLVAATNRDLLEEVRKGRFREDLYYRLNVFPIKVPPLRERADDIPLLVWTFLEEICSRMGKKITQVPRSAMDELQRRAWRGNVRELRNVIEHAAILTKGDTLNVVLPGEAAPVGAPEPTLAESERQLITRVLESRRWHVKGAKGAAAALGLKPSTLYSRMKKLGIRPPGEAGDAQ